MPQNRADRSDRDGVFVRNPRPRRGIRAEENREITLARVEEKRQRAKPLCARPDDVRRPDIPAALRANVFLAKYSDQQKAEWDRAQQVSRKGNRQIGNYRHRALSLTVLHQPPPHHIQRSLAGIVADSLAVAAETPLKHLGFIPIPPAEEHETYRLLFTPARRPRDACHAHAERRITALADSLRQCRGNFAADRTMALDQFRIDASKFGFQLVAVDNGSASKGARTAADPRQPLGNHSTRATLRDRQRCASHFQVVEHDLFQRLALRRIDEILEFLFYFAGKRVHTRLR